MRSSNPNSLSLKTNRKCFSFVSFSSKKEEKSAPPLDSSSLSSFFFSYSYSSFRSSNGIFLCLQCERNNEVAEVLVIHLDHEVLWMSSQPLGLLRVARRWDLREEEEIPQERPSSQRAPPTPSPLVLASSSSDGGRRGCCYCLLLLLLRLLLLLLLCDGGCGLLSLEPCLDRSFWRPQSCDLVLRNTM